MILGDHQWLERREPHLQIETGEAVVHHQCLRCGRDVVTVLRSGRRHAVHVSAFLFYRFNDEVTERWLSEPCPGKCLPKDDEDRNILVAEILARDGESGTPSDTGPPWPRRRGPKRLGSLPTEV